MLLSPMRRCSAIGGGGGGASGMEVSLSLVLVGGFRFRFLPFEGGRWEVRWCPRGCMRLWGLLARSVRTFGDKEDELMSRCAFR